MENNPSDLSIEELNASFFNYHDEDDSYVYHVTSSDRVASILEDGFDSSNKMMAAAYHGYSEGRVFFTEKSGVMFWMSRVEDRLFDQFDDPPEVSVVRIAKEIITSRLTSDDVGSADAKHPAYYAGVEAVNRAISSSASSVDSIPLDHHLNDDFFKWFEGSKVVDDEGSPRLLFHGTNSSFDNFNMSSGWFGTGAYFTDDPQVASEYAYDDEPGANVIPVYLRLENPYIFTETNFDEPSNIQLMRALGATSKEINAATKSGQSDEIIKDILEGKGYDGVIAHQVGEPVEYVAFSSGQIRFAIKQDWDPSLVHSTDAAAKRKVRP